MMLSSGINSKGPVAVWEAPRALFPWMTRRSGYTPLPDATGIVAVLGSAVLGMVVFDGFTETLAQVHVALATPRAAGALFRPAFRFAFRQAERLAIATVLDARNGKAVALAEGLGFREKGRLVDGAAVGADLVLYELRREECRYLRERH